jgi:aerobic-type carbon monoxide dehydrogenase small subunit (CoxS/CutS family)
VPFNSTRKYHLVIVKDMLEKNDTPTKANYILLMKGTVCRQSSVQNVCRCTGDYHQTL